MHWHRLAIGILLMTVVVSRLDAAEPDAESEPPRRFSVTFAAGSHLHDAGDLQALSFSYSPHRAWALLVNVERNHVPTRVHYFSDGYGATRGGTLASISGEFRYTLWNGTRVSPFVFAGTGVGRSQPNVNEMFPDRVTNVAHTTYAGAGVVFPVSPALAVSIDTKFAVVAERGEVGAMAPIRVGAVWRF
jgi:hypothetical protein